MTIKIKFDRGQAKMLGLMTEAELPDADELKEMIYACVFLDEDSYDQTVLASLVKTYVAVLDDLLFQEESEDASTETVTYDCDFTSEKIWLKYVVIGYLSGFSKEVAESHRKAEEEEPNAIIELVTGYHFSTDIQWPPKMLAEVAYAQGYRDYRRAVEMTKFFQEQASLHSEYSRKPA